MHRLFLWLPIALSAASAALDPTDTYRPRDTQPPGAVPPTPQEALAAFRLPPDLQATVFAAEPDVRQPIDIKTDDRGRLWVCEAYSYKEWQRKREDRILIFTDRDGDGVADERKVFRSGFNHLSSVEIGFGGVWVLDSPDLLFYADRNGDDVPDGEPDRVLDGWTTEAGHNTVSGLTWGLDGWLYGRHGISQPSLVGKPGTAEKDRIFIEPGVWRIHPVTRKFEVVVRGMTNPWGLDWNEDGEMFLSGNVNGHLWHGIPGALYERMFGTGSVPNDYERLLMIGERPHYAGTGDWRSDWLRAEKGRDSTNDLGGGHSHCGLLVYQGNGWPDRYRGHLFMCNTHGRRVNEETVEPRGSSYVGKHLGDALTVNTPWFRGVSLVAAPDGNVFLSDWCDFGECHDDDGVHRSSGRIYKISGRPAAGGLVAPAPLAGAGDFDLAKLMLSRNEWHVRHARRLLQERAAAGLTTAPEALAKLREIMESDEGVTHRLRALWTLHALGAATEKDRLRFSKSPVVAHRVWGVRLIAEQERPSETEMARLLEMAGRETSARVRLELASVVARLSPEFAWTLASRVAGPLELNGPDAARDGTLELVLWHVLEPLVPGRPAEAAALAQATPYPKLRQFVARRLGVALDDEDARGAFGALLTAASADDGGWTDDIFTGAMAALEGRANRPPPPGWPAIADKLLGSSRPKAREAGVALSVAFNDRAVLDQLRRTFRSTRDGSVRARALEALRQAGVADLPAMLTEGLNEPPLRLTALRGLGACTDPGPATLALTLWPQLSPTEKSLAVDGLAARASTARQLLNALAAGRIARSDITITQARQIKALKDPEASQLLTQGWGDLRSSSADTEALIARYRTLLTSTPPEPPSVAHGRVVFHGVCAACHTLFGEGGTLGPNLTGSGRKDLDYVLRNVLDPSAVVAKDYKMTVVTLKDGQVLSGVVPAEDATTVTVQTIVERRVIERARIAAIEPQPFSWMPEGLLPALPESDVRDLVAYLASDAGK